MSNYLLFLKRKNNSTKSELNSKLESLIAIPEIFSLS